MAENGEQSEYVLVTGASAGLGVTFAERFAEQGKNLVLVARREERLVALAKRLREEYAVQAEIIAMDLGQHDSAERLRSEIEERGLTVRGLVNNAAFGWLGRFEQQETDTLSMMLNLNVVTLTKLCRLFAKDLAEKGDGFILNVASAGAFQAVPYFAVYTASKAYILSFSVALAEEFEGRVRIFCLCPGATHTEFAELAGADDDDFIPGGWQTAAEVVDHALAQLAGKASFGVPGVRNRMLMHLNRLLPRQAAAQIAGAIFKRALHDSD